MNPFHRLINDVFSAKDFVEHCNIQKNNGDVSYYNVPCIVSSIVNEAEYTAYGLDDGINFYLMFKLSQYQPQKNDRITYNNKTYKVDSFTIDSANQSVSVYLKALSSK